MPTVATKAHAHAQQCGPATLAEFWVLCFTHDELPRASAIKHDAIFRKLLQMCSHRPGLVVCPSVQAQTVLDKPLVSASNCFSIASNRYASSSRESTCPLHSTRGSRHAEYHIRTEHSAWHRGKNSLRHSPPWKTAVPNQRSRASSEEIEEIPTAF